MNELVRLDDVPFKLYSGKTHSFVCEAVEFLFAEPLLFEIVYREGSKLKFESATPDSNLTNLKWGRRYVNGVNHIYQLELPLLVNMTGIRCGAPFGNGTETLWTNRTFEVKGFVNVSLQYFTSSFVLIQVSSNTIFDFMTFQNHENRNLPT